MSDKEEDSPKRFVTDVSHGPIVIARNFTNVLEPTFKDHAFITSASSAAVGEGVVYLTSDRKANVYVHEGKVTEYNFPTTKHEDKPEISINHAEKQITETWNWILRQKQSSIDLRQGDAKRWFSLMLASGVLAVAAFGLGGILVLTGYFEPGIFSELLAALTGYSAKFFFDKDRELRNDIDRELDRVHDMYNSLAAFQVANTIEDENDKRNAKRQIISKMLGVPEKS